MNTAGDNATPDPPDGFAERPATLQAPERRPGIWSGFGTVVLYFVVQLGVGVVIWLLAALAMGIAGGYEDVVQHRGSGFHVSMGALVELFRTNADVQTGIAIVTIVAAAAIMIAIVRRAWPAQWSRADPPGFGLVKPQRARVYVAAVVLAIAVQIVGGLLTTLLARGHPPVQQNVVTLLRDAPLGMRVPLAIVAVCVAPFVEELLFRGVFLSGLARRMHVVWAIVISAIVFGGAHSMDFHFVYWYALPELTLVGLVLGWLRVRTHSLWPSITMHATFNFLAVLGMFVLVHLH